MYKLIVKKSSSVKYVCERKLCLKITKKYQLEKIAALMFQPDKLSYVHQSVVI